ncbi:MAG: hypothetical protein DRJ69_05875 [Thermoprotei archaeon]|nr:MAG: hypothetical protein DRJ69_05875 [Thermoprotei archaeon]
MLTKPWRRFPMLLLFFLLALILGGRSSITSVRVKASEPIEATAARTSLTSSKLSFLILQPSILIIGLGSSLISPSP